MITLGTTHAGTLESIEFKGRLLPVFVPESQPRIMSADGLVLKHATLPVILIADPELPADSTHIPPPSRASLYELPQAATASFVIDYIPAGSADLWNEACHTFPETAKAAFNAAASIWANSLQSPVPITIKACWADLGSSSTLGYSGSGSVHHDFPGAPYANTWFSASLANSRAGYDLDANDHDMHITYNKNFSWYYGTDGNTPSGQYDLMSVVLHEIAHGLNFSGSASVSGGRGTWGWGTNIPVIYDRFAYSGSGVPLLNADYYPNDSSQLAALLTSNDLWFRGSNAMSANGGVPVKIYAPASWASGSSYAHLDKNTFAASSANRLMVYAISSGIATHDPGPVTMGLLKDLGWMTGSPGSTGYLLTVGKSGSGSGTVTSSPAGINCGSDCSGSYSSGTSVTLTATPSTGSTFAGWSGACSGTGTCSISMTAASSVTARWRPKRVRVFD